MCVSKILCFTFIDTTKFLIISKHFLFQYTKNIELTVLYIILVKTFFFKFDTQVDYRLPI